VVDDVFRKLRNGRTDAQLRDTGKAKHRFSRQYSEIVKRVIIIDITFFYYRLDNRSIHFIICFYVLQYFVYRSHVKRHRVRKFLEILTKSRSTQNP